MKSISQYFYNQINLYLPLMFDNYVHFQVCSWARFDATLSVKE